jgi:hypothetical protein
MRHGIAASPFAVLLLVPLAFAQPATAQASAGPCVVSEDGTTPGAVTRPVSAVESRVMRIQRDRLGRIDLCDGASSVARVGWLGGGLGEVTAGNVEAQGLASRFRMQRRTGLLLSVLAVAGSAVVFQRFADTRQDPLELGDPESFVLMGAMGALVGGMVQLNASRGTLDRLADSLAGSRW